MEVANNQLWATYLDYKLHSAILFHTTQLCIPKATMKHMQEALVEILGKLKLLNSWENIITGQEWLKRYFRFQNIDRCHIVSSFER